MPQRPVLIGTALAAMGVTLLLALPAIGQPAPGDAPPKSLLPDSFGDAPAPAPAPAAAQPLPEAVPGNAVEALPPPLLAPPPPQVAQADPFAIPEAASGEISVSGPLTVAGGGYGTRIFAGSNGRFLHGLARRITDPIGSRWAAITLRRALMSNSAAPAGIVPGDWVAVRALLLLRMGEIDGAKALVDGVPVDRYSPQLYRVAGQVALAAADIGGLCPIARTGSLLSKDSLWPLARGMCAAMQGDDITAAQLFDDLRNDNRTNGFDVRLGERVATVAGGAGRATNIEWSEAPPLTPYRYGVATAAGVAVPAERLAALGPARFGWMVRNPGLSPEIRLAALRPAAVLGSVSAAELTSGITALSPGDAAADTPAGRLRTAFAGGSMADRRAALQAIWAAPAEGDARYGGLIESALAASRLPVGDDSAAISPGIIAALLSAGMGDAARRWWPVADKAGGAVRARAWALLAVGAGGVPVTPSAFRDWRSDGGADDRRAGMLLAALAGLGAAPAGDWDGLRDDYLPKGATAWSRAIAAAAAAGRGGEVIILSATGLQGSWADVPPLHLYHIIAGLVRTGHPAEARMIAAEALTRS